MRTYDLTHVSDAVLVHQLHVLVAKERTTTAEVLAHIAEVDSRRLYLPAGYHAMIAYCVGELHFTTDAAYKRIQAARAARQFPAIFDALAAGRLHLAAACLLAPHLTPENADELIAAALGRTKAEVERLLVERFLRPEMPALVQVPGSAPLASGALAPGQVEGEAAERLGEIANNPLAPGQVGAPVSQPPVSPPAPQRFIPVDQETYDQLSYAKALLSHRVPAPDVAGVIKHLLAESIPRLEKRKFAATSKPRQGSRRSSANPRYIPAHVKRAVRERDQGQCTFVGDTGHRCSSRTRLEYDHIIPVARGGQATVEGIRLRCRAHNQFEAERLFGAGFMSEKREAARRARAEAQTRVAAEEAEARARAAEAEARSRAIAKEHTEDVMACLCNLGYRAGEARRAAESCESMPDATLEERVRAALTYLCPKPRFRGRVETRLAMRT